MLDYFKINSKELPNLLKNFLLYGKTIYQIKSKINSNRDGYERLCKYAGFYLLFAIGLNGFIVTTYIKNEKQAKKLMEVNKNEKN